MAASITGVIGAGVIMYLVNRLSTSPKISKISENAGVL